MSQPEKSPEEIQEAQMVKLEQMKKDYATVFSTNEGKRVLANLEEVCYIHRTTFPKDAQALTLAFHEGMRYVIVHIRNMAKMDINRLKELIKEGG